MWDSWGLIVSVGLLIGIVAGLLGTRGAAGDAPSAPIATAGAEYRLDEATAEREGARYLDAAMRAAPLRFADDVSPQDRELILGAIAAAQPDARRLIDLVDGLALVRVGTPGSGAAGEAHWTGDGSYELLLDVPGIWHRAGARGVTMLVLHEVGHVLDGALLPDGLVGQLDVGIPQGQGCDEWSRGGCAPPEERFADTFAKWATGDLGFELHLGYNIPPPAIPLARWGEPLAAFGR